MTDYCFHMIAFYYLYIVSYEVKYDLKYGMTLITFTYRKDNKAVTMCFVINSKERISDIIAELDIAVLNNHGQRRY